MTSWDGRWVPANGPPPYVQAEAAAGANPQSRLIPEACRSRQSWRWRWQSGSESCRFVVPTQAELCARLAGKRILLYGDSLTQQFFVSLASIGLEKEAYEIMKAFDLHTNQGSTNVGSPRKARNLSIMAISASIALLFGQCDAHCFSSWHDDRHRSYLSYMRCSITVEQIFFNESRLISKQNFRPISTSLPKGVCTLIAF